MEEKSDSVPVFFFFMKPCRFRKSCFPQRHQRMSHGGSRKPERSPPQQQQSASVAQSGSAFSSCLLLNIAVTCVVALTTRTRTRKPQQTAAKHCVCMCVCMCLCMCVCVRARRIVSRSGFASMRSWTEVCMCVLKCIYFEDGGWKVCVRLGFPLLWYLLLCSGFGS